MSDPTSPLQQFDGPRVDPRFRRRWAEARRAEGRRRLKALLGVVALAAVVGAGIGLLHSPVFRVRNVEVIGNAHTPRAQVLAAAGLVPGHGDVLMVDAGPQSATRALNALPWVAAATFERRWPWTVVIRVKERAPVARVMSGNAEDVVDKSGRVLEVSPPRTTKPVPELPLIIGAQGASAGAYVSPDAGLNASDLGELLAAANDAPHASGGTTTQGGVLRHRRSDGLYRIRQNRRVARRRLRPGSEISHPGGAGDPSKPRVLLPSRPHGARAARAYTFTIRCFGRRLTGAPRLPSRGGFVRYLIGW